MATAAVGIDAIRGAVYTVETGLADDLELEGNGSFAIDSRVARDRGEVAADGKACHLCIHAIHMIITREAVVVVHLHKQLERALFIGKQKRSICDMSQWFHSI